MFCSVGHKKGADKRVEAAKKELAELQAALESKEKELQAQHGELERLRQVEEQFLQAEKAECERLQDLAGSLTG